MASQRLILLIMYQTSATLLFLTLAFMNLTRTTLQAKSFVSTRLVVKLVHRDSVHSPYFDQKDNDTDRIKRALESSIARFTNMQKVVRALADDDFQADLLPNAYGSAFLANISIGNPPVLQFLLMDTGSSFIWIHCLTFERRSEQIDSVFDPTKSSTYANISCFSKYCRYAPRPRCNQFNQCEYHQSYIQGTPSEGILSEDKLTLKTSDEGSVSISNVIFGCGNKNGNFKDRRTSGVLGLGFKKISLVAQLGAKFSYCIGNVLDPTYSHNKLILGNKTSLEGESTPLEVINGQYYVTLEGISVGDRRLAIDSNMFRRNKLSSKRNGVIVDSGAVATWLVKEGYEALKNEVESLLSMCFTPFLYKSYALCYRGQIDEDLVGFPTVTFHFVNGAELVLDQHSLFIQIEPYAFCMAVFPSYAAGESLKTLSLIGLLAQQNYNVGYDIYGKTMTFQSIDCELLDD